ncbi:hypothetical protein HMPREF9466_02715 [Fusobacterium necrophorum subsp. funduliforme 1_1_36S]|nr:hypothetical protein HMPREF9466_02715 [Fusobacterium necrophorum subsp. funduliforme 1_1_36S]
MIVACIPGSDTIDLKKLAKVSSSKKSGNDRDETIIADDRLSERRMFSDWN